MSYLKDEVKRGMTISAILENINLMPDVNVLEQFCLLKQTKLFLILNVKIRRETEIIAGF